MKKSNQRIDVLLACLIACEKCSTHSINEGNKECSILCRDCADICALCAQLEARGSIYAEELRVLCAKVCRACSLECAKHASHHEICKICSERCDECAEICEEMKS